MLVMTTRQGTRGILVAVAMLSTGCGGCRQSDLHGDVSADDGILEDLSELVLDGTDPETTEEPSTDIETDELAMEDPFEDEVDEEIWGDCRPDCPSWIECGGDGCGGSCGDCPTGTGCHPVGVCVPEPCATPILVPAGDFVMGSDPDEGDSILGINEKPEHVVRLSDFQIDACEVTNLQWSACQQAGVCSVPAYGGRSWTRDTYYYDSAYRFYPMITITWSDAKEYCVWTGGDLPTEAQWEKAARGGCELSGSSTTCDDPDDEREFPWGMEPPSCSLCNCAPSSVGECTGDTTEVGQYLAGDSPYGVHGLAGNVSEWTADYYSSSYYTDGGPPWVDPTGPSTGTYYVIRGGSFGHADELSARLAYRSYYGPGSLRGFGLGLRCVY